MGDDGQQTVAGLGRVFRPAARLVLKQQEPFPFGLRVFLIRNIRVRAEPTDNISIGPSNGDGTRQEPAISPVLATQWKVFSHGSPVAQVSRISWMTRST